MKNSPEYILDRVNAAKLGIVGGMKGGVTYSDMVGKDATKAVSILMPDKESFAYKAHQSGSDDYETIVNNLREIRVIGSTDIGMDAWDAAVDEHVEWLEGQ